MEYATLGRTGRRVSRLGFGGATAGLKNYLTPFDPVSRTDRDAIVEALHEALRLGVTYFDTAPGYGDGASEEICGEALSGVDPESLFLATKVGLWQGGDVRQSLEASLKRLRRNWVDLLQIHGTAYDEPQSRRVLEPGGFLDQLERLRDEGLIRHIGFTSEALNVPFYRFIQTGRFAVMQVCYNVVFQHPYDPSRQSGCLYDAEAQGMGIVTMRSTTSGMLQKWIQTVNPANDFDYTPAMIQFEFSNPLVDVALVGMRSAEQVRANVALCDDKAGRIDLDELFRRYV